MRRDIKNWIVSLICMIQTRLDSFVLCNPCPTIPETLPKPKYVHPKCPHGRQRSTCKECGGASICEHGRERPKCKECGGASICEHGRLRRICPICDPCGHAISLRRSRRYETTKAKNPTGALEDLCMTSKDWVRYLHELFEVRYGRPKTDNDEVQIDEIIPCSAWNLPDDNKYCWHYLNSQWLIDNTNQEKGTKYTEEDKRAMIERIDEWFIANPYQPSP